MKLLITFFLILDFSVASLVYRFPAERYRTGQVTWLGLDFTMAQFINGKAFEDPEMIVSSYIPDWNNIVIKEAAKFNVKKLLHKSDMVIDLELTDHFNSKISSDNIVYEKNISIEPGSIYEDSRKYATLNNKGLGVVLYVETYNKVTLLGIYRLVIIDLETGDSLFSEKILQKPKGFGIKNFWLDSFYNSLKYLDKKMALWGIA